MGRSAAAERLLRQHVSGDPPEVKYVHWRRTTARCRRGDLPAASWVMENVIGPMRKGIADGNAWSTGELGAVRVRRSSRPERGSMKEFIAWSKLPTEDVRKAWPQEAIKKYEKEHKASACGNWAR